MKKLVLFLALAFGLSILSTQAAPANGLSHYERKIVASCLVLEASSDGIEGMQAVLNVIHNRAGGDIRKIVRETVRPKQFSSLNPYTGKSSPDFGPLIRRALKDPNFNNAYKMVILLERGQLADITFGADHFHANYIQSPNWTTEMQYTTSVGAHIFYRSERNAAEATAFIGNQ